MMANKNSIIKNNIILCEGADALYFFIWLLGDAAKENNLFEEFQVFDFGGIAQLRNFISMLKNMDGYENVSSISIVRDAEKNYSAAISSVKSSLLACELPCPQGPIDIAVGENIKIGFALFPSCTRNNQNGTLEDLCLNILDGSRSFIIMRDVKKILRKKRYRLLTRSHKNKMHTYFSLTNKFVAMKIGEAAQANAFKRNAAEIKSLKEFLLSLLP